MTIELEKILPPELYERLNAEAERQNTPVGDLLRDALTAYFEEDADDEDDTTEAEILEGFRQGWRDMLDGNVIAADEAMDQLRAIIEEEASR
jgi:predicted DNA-binding protein